MSLRRDWLLGGVKPSCRWKVKGRPLKNIPLGGRESR